MEVILLEKVSKLGNIGETVRVKDGFARNYLIPKKVAIRATEENKKVFEGKKEELEKVNLEKMHNILHLTLEQIAKISILLNPIIPNASTKVLDALNINAELKNFSFLDGKNIITNEIKIKELDILFKKITK